MSPNLPDLSELFSTITTSYPAPDEVDPDEAARSVANYPEVQDAFRQARDLLDEEITAELGDDFTVDYGFGQGTLAHIPSIAVLRSDVTMTTQRGIYVVYLFDPITDRVYLTLNQGATEINRLRQSEDVSLTRAEALRRHADYYRPFIQSEDEDVTVDSSTQWVFDEAGLSPELRQADVYNAGTICYKEYTLEDLHSTDLYTDLRILLQGYNDFLDKIFDIFPVDVTDRNAYIQSISDREEWKVWVTERLARIVPGEGAGDPGEMTIQEWATGERDELNEGDIIVSGLSDNVTDLVYGIGIVTAAIEDTNQAELQTRAANAGLDTETGEFVGVEWEPFYAGGVPISIPRNNEYLFTDRRIRTLSNQLLERIVAGVCHRYAAVEQRSTAWLADNLLTDLGVSGHIQYPQTEDEEETDEPTTDEGPTDFKGVAEATATVLDRLADSAHENILRDHYSTDQIIEWSRALEGFQANAFVESSQEAVLHEFEEALYDQWSRLDKIARDLNIGSLDAREPAEVVFLAFLRDIQQSLQSRPDIDFQINANSHKLNVLQRRRYEVFDHPSHPLVERVRSEATVWSITAPADYWLTALRYRACGFEPADEDTVANIEQGDLLIFHAGGEPMDDKLSKHDGFVFGVAVAGRTFDHEQEWRFETREGTRSHPHGIAFDRLFLTEGATVLRNSPAATADATVKQTALEQLREGAFPIRAINDRCTEVTGERFPVRNDIEVIEDDKTFGRREAIVDLLSGATDEVSPIAIDRSFNGAIPASVFEKQLHFPERPGIVSAKQLAEQVTAALRAGKHIIFTGPPGTGKTEIAECVVEHLESAYPYLYSGSQLTTATADWSTFDTVGGYMPDPDAEHEQLDFHPGVILNRFKRPSTHTQANEPLIIDEINRANIDKAFGQIFTTLSGQSVTVPYRLKAEPDREIRIATHDEAETPPPKSQFIVPASWRILATMNTFDKTSLYEMSYAFMRRFSFIRVGVPEIPAEGAERERFVSGYATVWELDVDPTTLRNVGAVWRATNEAVDERAIGPAIVEDILSYLTKHDTPADQRTRMTEAIVSYIFPQLEGVPERDVIVREIADLDVLDRDALADAAEDMLGVTNLEASD